MGARPRRACAEEAIARFPEEALLASKPTAAGSHAGPGYVIRRVEPRDGDAVTRELAAYLAHIGEALDGEGLDHDVAHWEREYGGAAGVLLVVESPEGAIVGTAAVRRLAPDVGEVKRMWVRPECQGLGLGRRLMDRCLDEARSRGFRVLRLDTERRMQSALRLYRSYGFTEIADYNGNPRAEIWMELTLRGGHGMATATVTELRKKTDAALANLTRQLEGMEFHLERADAPGEWTTRQVLCHLLFEPGWAPAPVLKSFAHQDLPVIEIQPGLAAVTPERQTMTLAEHVRALDTQRAEVFAYLDGLSDADLQRKARIPLFKQFMGTDEITIPVYVGALFDHHWHDHAGQLAKIRAAVGLGEAK